MRKPIKKRSKKMDGVMNELKKLYPIFLSSRPDCEIRSPVCTGAATIIHHKKGRIGRLVLDTGFWVGACPSCNLYVEEHDKWARDNGHKISKFS